MNRFDVAGCERTMMAVVTTGNGGYDKLDYRAVPIPEPRSGEVLLRVLAAGINNTEINTRLGWYSSSITEARLQSLGIKNTPPNRNPTAVGMRRHRFRSSRAPTAVDVWWRSGRVLMTV